uniref:Uncharacterized protein n=1 Tax=Micromonas pusilla TaxID=38833 RepID=A0A7R9TMP5_MICPS|mmetsp:Transcript_4327/g.15244  ORF Transcript_4327/g.15244 Transcript_4327/m.15244 type:complete len:392 (+) Transcript_4327:50-1225(+)
MTSITSAYRCQIAANRSRDRVPRALAKTIACGHRATPGSTRAGPQQKKNKQGKKNGAAHVAPTSVATPRAPHARDGDNVLARAIYPVEGVLSRDITNAIAETQAALLVVDDIQRDAVEVLKRNETITIKYFDYWNPDAQREFVEMIQPPSGEESYASGALRGIEAVDKKTRLRLEASARAAAALDAMREVKRQDAEKAASAAAAAAAVAERERINAETATARAAAAVAEAKEHREKAAEEARAFYERSQLELKMKRELEDAQRELIAASNDLAAAKAIRLAEKEKADAEVEAAEAEAEDEAAEAAEAEEAEEAHENNAVAVPSQLEELAQLAKSFVRGTASDPAAKLINNILHAEVPESHHESMDNVAPADDWQSRWFQTPVLEETLSCMI